LTAAGQTASPPELPSAPSAVAEQNARPHPPPSQPQGTTSANPASAVSPNSSPKNPAGEGSSGGADQSLMPASEAVAPTNPTAPAAAAPANPAKSPGDSDAVDHKPAETIRVPVNEVNLIFTVTDKHGHFIRNLTQNDIKVVDDHKPVDSLRSFRSETDLPLRVGLLVDASNSVRDRFKFEQESAIEFLNQIVRPRTDQAFVLGFDTVPEVTADFTNDTEKLSRGVRMLRAGGGTAMYDAIYYACRDKLMKSSNGLAVRKAMILLSDGEDNQSRVSRDEAVEMAQRAEVIVYTISTNTSGLILKGDKVLEYIAETTGGRFFQPFKIEDVSNAFSEIQEELRSQYSLAYKPPEFRADGRYRSIEVIAENNKKLRVRYRKGYFAPLP
jgi:Ca-activated chloride channel homolog